jgi:Putative Flp pilus-assembly TadE/G-like
MFKRRSGERGQILVIVAGGILGIIAIAALVLEGGTMVLNRRDAQNSADLASVAGTHIVARFHTMPAADPGRPTTVNQVYSSVQASMNVNNCPAVGAICTWQSWFVDLAKNRVGGTMTAGDSSTIPSNAAGVQVGVTRTPASVFGRLFGQGTWTITTEATAQTKSLNSVGQGVMLPIAVCGWNTTGTPNDCSQASQNPNPGNFIDFKPFQIYDLTDGKDAPGGFGWLSWNGSNSANIMADRICNPNNPGFSLDSPYDAVGTPGGVMGTDPATGETWFPIDPGKSNSSGVRACLDQWITSKQTVLVPIYDVVHGNGNNAWYHITGVAAFILTAREQPAIDQIQGMFVEYYPLSEIPGNLGTLPTQGDTSYSVSLVR